ncbi:hypothetical protein [Escherichia coli]|uniref:hypothetical protein n=1 Tax=Escherichia coli TaxID=562 RepID=UPI00388E507F|nr:hypothetical protein [Escherichia coli]
MPAKNHQNRSYPARRSPVFNRQIEQLRTGNSLTVCILSWFVSGDSGMAILFGVWCVAFHALTGIKNLQYHHVMV